MANTKMGFEGLLYIGTAGSTAATQLTNVKDITETYSQEKGNTTVRGAGSSVPLTTEDVTSIGYSIDFTMIVDSTDTNLSTLRGHAAAGTSVAIRTVDYSGSVGFDGDCTVTMTKGKPLAGEMTIQFTATPTRGAGRAPVLNT